MKKDTIAAISTGMTNSGIGIVRLSGNEALEIADKVYREKKRLQKCRAIQFIMDILQTEKRRWMKSL